jgi:hypothetical protein
MIPLLKVVVSKMIFHMVSIINTPEIGKRGERIKGFSENFARIRMIGFWDLQD